MRHFLSILLAVLAIWMLGAQAAWAQGAEWPAYPLKDGWSGPGFYLAWWKIPICWLIFLAWVYTTDWVNEDLQEKKLDYLRWNPIVFGSFMGAFVLSWLIPFFWLNLFLLLAAYVAPLTSYIVVRNGKVPVNERVLTRAHLRYWFAEKASMFGMKVQAEARDPHETGPPVILTARGGAAERDNNVRLLSARQAPGFRDARQILGDGLGNRGDAIMLDYAQQAVAVRYLVDGVWLDAQPRERESSDPALEALKILCGLNPQDRQGRQEGKFAAEYKGENMPSTLATQGTPTGERVVVQMERKKTRFNSLDELGMRQKMQEQLKELLGQERGLVLVSAPPAGGLRTTTHWVLRSMDRFMREFMAVEDEANRYDPVENVPVTTYKPEQKHDLADLLDKLFHQEPNVVVVRDLVDAKLLGILCEEMSNNKRLLISTIRAKECADALARVLALKVPPAELAKHVIAVLNQRLIRKLCESCKEAYQPTPEILQQLQIPPGKVQAFYRPPQPNPEEKKEVCRRCNGVGYFGRTAVFELLAVDDGVRKVLATTPKLDALRQAARNAGMRTMQEEGIILVAKGVTSLPELMRVMKQ